MTVEKIIPASIVLRDRWSNLKVALSVAAEPYTGQLKFSISPFYAYDLIEGRAEADKQLANLPTGAQHQYATDSDGNLTHHVRWMK